MKLNSKKLKKGVIYILGIVISIYLLVGLYSFIFEQDKLAIDRYNFKQLEKAKPILESIPENAKKFYSLKEFNEQYKADIKPIENCYHISNNNGDQKYIFGFRMESKIYKLIYWNYYSYPSYNIPFDKICTGKCYDSSKLLYKYIISNPCKN